MVEDTVGVGGASSASVASPASREAGGDQLTEAERSHLVSSEELGAKHVLLPPLSLSLSLFRLFFLNIIQLRSSVLSCS